MGELLGKRSSSHQRVASIVQMSQSNNSILNNSLNAPDNLLVNESHRSDQLNSKPLLEYKQKE